MLCPNNSYENGQNLLHSFSGNKIASMLKCLQLCANKFVVKISTLLKFGSEQVFQPYLTLIISILSIANYEVEIELPKI